MDILFCMKLLKLLYIWNNRQQALKKTPKCSETILNPLCSGYWKSSREEGAGPEEGREHGEAREGSAASPRVQLDTGLGDLVSQDPASQDQVSQVGLPRILVANIATEYYQIVQIYALLF